MANIIPYHGHMYLDLGCSQQLLDYLSTVISFSLEKGDGENTLHVYVDLQPQYQKHKTFLLTK